MFCALASARRDQLTRGQAVIPHGKGLRKPCSSHAPFPDDPNIWLKDALAAELAKDFEDSKR